MAIYSRTEINCPLQDGSRRSWLRAGMAWQSQAALESPRGAHSQVVFWHLPLALPLRKFSPIREMSISESSNYSMAWRFTDLKDGVLSTARKSLFCLYMSCCPGR